jgi:RNA polymerase sigma factor (sigma-70 family)
MVALGHTSAAADPVAEGLGHSLPLSEEFRQRYRIGRRLGVGASGTVYLGWAPQLRRAVAIKFLRRVDNNELLSRFIREGKIMRSLDHPNVVRVLDSGKVGDLPYLVCEHVGGGTLRDRLGQAQGRLPVGDAIETMRDVLAGLESCHAVGVTHRDLKPENILLTDRGEAKLTDFGIARMGYGLETALTREGYIVGTPLYMAPEQLRGEPIDAACDIFAAGAILYELIAGHTPFRPTSLPELVYLHERVTPDRLDRLVTDVPEKLATLVARALARNPTDRPASAMEMAVSLHEVAAAPAEPAAAAPGSISEMDDPELMGASAGGDLAAFEELVRRHQTRAWRLAVAMLRDPVEAQDIAQTAFLKILAGAGSYRATAKFSTYLRCVVTRLCLDHLERKAPIYRSDLGDVPVSDPTPATALHERQTRMALRDALEALPPMQRAALLLRYYEGMSHREIGEALDVTPKAVERLVDRGRRTLAERLGNDPAAGTPGT